MYIQSSMKEINFMSEGASNERSGHPFGGNILMMVADRCEGGTSKREGTHHFCSSSISSDVKQNVNNFFSSSRPGEAIKRKRNKKHAQVDIYDSSAIFNACG